MTDCHRYPCTARPERRAQRSGTGGSQDYNFNHNVTLWNQNGTQAAPPFSINTSVAAAAPHGT
jgi:hypothetical protein